MNKTEKLIAAALLANIALAGALHFLPSANIPVDQPGTPVTTSPTEVVPVSRDEITPTLEVAAPEVIPVDSADNLREWARRNPGTAIEWAAQHPDGENRETALETACFEIANTNPAEAVALAEKYALTNHATLDNLTQQWASSDLPAAETWVLAKPTGEERDQLVARVGYVWSATQPAAAADFVVQEIPPGSAQTEAAISVLHQWALRNFNDAAAWVDLFPEGEIRQRAIRELAGIREYSQADGSQK